jgi:hypothetical protein
VCLHLQQGSASMPNRLDKLSPGNSPSSFRYVAGHRDRGAPDLACQPVKLVTRKSRRRPVNQLTKIDPFLPSDQVSIRSNIHTRMLICYFTAYVHPKQQTFLVSLLTLTPALTLHQTSSLFSNFESTLNPLSVTTPSSSIRTPPTPGK